MELNVIKKKLEDYEKELITILLYDPSAIEKDNVKIEMFSQSSYQTIFKKIKEEFDALGEGYSYESIKDLFLSTSKEEHKDAWLAFFASIESLKNDGELPTSAHIVKRINEIKGVDNLQNHIIKLQQNLTQGDIGYLEEFKKNIEKINLFSGKTGSYTLHSSMQGAFDYLKEGYERGEAFSGISSGLDVLDKMLSGLNMTDLITIAGRPAMGKTALAITLADNIANRNNVPVGFISSEMPREQLSLRMIARNTGIDSIKMRRFDLLTEEDLLKIKDFMSRVENSPFYVNDKAGISCQDIEEQIKIWVNEYGVKVVFIDYLQKIKWKGYNAAKMSRTETIGEITSEFKNYAKKYGISVVQLAQLNREGEGSDPNERPGMQHLKGSGDIEQESDSIIFPFRPNARTDNTPEPKKVELIIPKNRHGPIGTASCLWLPTSVSFEDIEEEIINF